MSTTNPAVDELAGVRRPRALAGAGLVYVSAWLIGLATAPSAPSPDAADATIHAVYADNGSAALFQATLVHGIAGVALAVFIVALVRRLAVTSSQHRTLVLIAGLAAAALALAGHALVGALIAGLVVVNAVVMHHLQGEPTP